MITRRTLQGLVTVVFLVAIACEREERGFRVNPPDAQRVHDVRMTTLQPGVPATQSTPDNYKNDYENNAYALSQGKQLFGQMNCVGCHAHGGGAIGPALMDSKWIYGGQPDQIFATIIEGRPNGMPAFGGKLPDYQIWQLAAYVRSLSGNASRDAAPGRDDDMQIGKPENSKKTQVPQQVTSP